MEKKKINNPFCGRVDGYEDKGADYSDPIQEVWSLVDKKVSTGDGEDDFIIEPKPVLLDRYDIDKKIQAAAKGADLASMVAQFLQTGDDSVFNKSQPCYADVTGYPDDPVIAHNAIIKGQKVFDTLPEDLKAKGIDGLINMSKADIDKYINDKVQAILKEKGQAAEPAPVEVKEVNK